MIRYRRDSWVADAIAGIDTYGMTQEDYERAQARAMVDKMNRKEKMLSKEAYEDRKRGRLL